MIFVFFIKNRENEILANDVNILRIHFEDLIYNYNATIQHIFHFLSIPLSQHVFQKKYFNPSKSILNTQIFNRETRFLEEANFIKDELKKYIYDFPILCNSKINRNDIIL